MGFWRRVTNVFRFGESSPKPDMAALGREIATRETAEFSSLIGILPDPDPVLRKMPGAGAAVLESLTADGHLMSVIGTRKAGTKAREYRWAPGSVTDKKPSPASVRLAEDLAADMENVDFQILINQILDAPLYGFTPIEIMWDFSSGRGRIMDLRALPCRWFGFDQNSAPRFLSTDNPWEGEELPFGKFVFARHDHTYDNPYGIRLLSRCLWPVAFKNGGIKFWVEFAEKYGSPFMVGKYPPGATADDQATMLSRLSAMVRTAVAVVPSGGSVDIIGGKAGGGATVFERLKTAMDAEMSKVVVGQTLTSEVGDKGSYAAGKVHENVLEAYQEADQKLVKTTMEEIAWIYGQVNDPGTAAPVFEWFEKEDLQTTRAERDQTLSGPMKDSGYRLAKSYFVRAYSFQEDDIEEIPNKGKPAAFAEPADSPLAAYQRVVDELTDSTIKAASADLSANEEKLLAIIQGSGSYEEAFEKLLDAFPSLDVDHLETLLARAITAADMYGRYAVDAEIDNEG